MLNTSDSGYKIKQKSIIKHLEEILIKTKL